jgi:hypothetical protein
MAMLEIDLIKAWWHMLADAWHTRRDEGGGVTDSTAMMGLLAVAAVSVGLIVIRLVMRAARRINLGF